MTWSGAAQYDPRDFTCKVCGHGEEDHDLEHYSCTVEGCKCDGFED